MLILETHYLNWRNNWCLLDKVFHWRKYVQKRTDRHKIAQLYGSEQLGEVKCTDNSDKEVST